MINQEKSFIARNGSPGQKTVFYAHLCKGGEKCPPRVNQGLSTAKLRSIAETHLPLSVLPFISPKDIDGSDITSHETRGPFFTRISSS